MKLINRINKKYLMLINFLWPFLGMLLAIKYYNKLNTNSILLLFCILCGFTLVLDPVSDSARYAEYLEMDYGKPFIESGLYYKITNLGENSLDFFQSFITYIVSRFTNSYHILFSVYALIFGFFWIKTIDYINQNFKFNQNNLTILYAVLLISIIPIFKITGFRMWTAAWVFIYGALHIIFTKKSKYFLFCLGACTIHFSYITANILLLIWFIIGNHKWVYLILALITLMVSELDFGIIRQYASYIAPAVESKANSYASEEYADKVNELRSNDAWFITISSILLKYLFLLNILNLFYISIKQKLSNKELNLLNFTLLFLTYANISSLIPSGSRFTIVFNVFATVVSLLLYSKYKYFRLNSVNGISSLFIIVLVVLVSFRVAASSINTILFAPSFLIPFGYDLNWPITYWLF